jgi:two-component system, chemotaxis family, sensor kinase CheA
MDNFRKKFLEEASEHIHELEKSLLELEVDPENKEIIEKVFRAMHSLKGGGAMFGFDKVSEFTHNLETVYDYVRNDKMAVNKSLLNITLASVDHLKRLLNEEHEDESSLKKDHDYLVKEIDGLAKSLEAPNKSVESTPLTKTKVETAGEFKTFFVRFIPNRGIFDNGTNPLYLVDEIAELGDTFVIPRLDKVPKLSEIKALNCYTYWDILLSTSSEINAITDIFIFVEDDCELEIIKIADFNILHEEKFIERLQQIKAKDAAITIEMLNEQAVEIKAAIEKREKKPVDKTTITTKESSISSIRVSSDKLDLLMNLVSELVTTQARLSLYTETDTRPELIGIAENVQKLTRQLRDIAFSIVLIPIENMLTRFQRLVRDLSNELKKDVSFVIEGAETELDKTIIENLADPLMHILRNSMDHGIEDPETRQKLGKPRQGKILLKAFYSGANVHIQVSDDGAGMDPEFIKSKAIDKGIISQDTILSRKDILDLIFIPGFSTADRITDLSGRGVGMDVVRRKISDIRGEVEVESEVGQGTTLTIKLPLTLSIIDGLLVKISHTNYIIPLAVVDKIYAVEHRKIAKAFNNVLILDGEQIPFFNLRHEFNEPESDALMEEVVVVRYEDKQVGIAVDTVLGEYQAVLKPLGKHYKRQEIISGATILGDGTIALVLDPNKTIKQFSNQNIAMEEVK